MMMMMMLMMLMMMMMMVVMMMMMMMMMIIKIITTMMMMMMILQLLLVIITIMIMKAQIDNFLDTSVSHLHPLSLARAWQGRIVCVDLRPDRGVDYMLSSWLLQSADFLFWLGEQGKGTSFVFL